jgi:DNA polymerase I
VLRELAGPPDSLYDPNAKNKGKAYKYFGGGENGMKACIAFDAVCRMGSIDTMLSSFIEPLQKLSDANGRVHCSLNLNTETGRLSSRRPNLQNQPALEKDQYKVLMCVRGVGGGGYC